MNSANFKYSHTELNIRLLLASFSILKTYSPFGTYESFDCFSKEKKNSFLAKLDKCLTSIVNLPDKNLFKKTE